MSIEGTLDELQVPDILQMVAQQAKTGILTVQGKDTIIAVSFLTGDVVAADSLQETVEQRLGQVLVREGKLTQEEFAEALARQETTQGRMVDLLVEEGYLSRQEVLASLRLQTRDLMVELVDWQEGDFKFYGNDEVAYEEGFQPIVVSDLLISMLPEDDSEDDLAVSVDASSDLSVDALAEDDGPALLPTEDRFDLGDGFDWEASGSEIRDFPDGELDDLPNLEVRDLSVLEPSTADEAPGALASDGSQDSSVLPSASSPQSAAEAPTSEDSFATLDSPSDLTSRAEEGFGEEEAFGERESFQDGSGLGHVVPLPVAESRTAELTADVPEDTVFVPPDDAVTVDSAKVRTDRSPKTGTALRAWLSGLLALWAAVAVVWALLSMPAHFLLPFPWQSAERDAYLSAQRQATYHSIDGAAKTFFLVEGRFPDTLEPLVDRFLLQEQHRRSSDGSPLRIQAREDSYVLQPRTADGSEPPPASITTDAITGNFLLDPEYLSAQPEGGRVPLVLLD